MKTLLIYCTAQLFCAKLNCKEFQGLQNGQPFVFWLSINFEKKNFDAKAKVALSQVCSIDLHFVLISFICDVKWVFFFINSKPPQTVYNLLWEHLALL